MFAASAGCLPSRRHRWTRRDSYEVRAALELSMARLFIERVTAKKVAALGKTQP